MLVPDCELVIMAVSLVSCGGGVTRRRVVTHPRYGTGSFNDTPLCSPGATPRGQGGRRCGAGATHPGGRRRGRCRGRVAAVPSLRAAHPVVWPEAPAQ